MKNKKQVADTKHKSDVYKALFMVSFFSGIGIYFAVSVLVFLYMGSLADEFFASTPKGRIIALVLSLPASFYFIYKKVRSFHF